MMNSGIPCVSAKSSVSGHVRDRKDISPPLAGSNSRMSLAVVSRCESDVMTGSPNRESSPETVTRVPPGQGIGNNQKQKVDDAVENADCRCIADLHLHQSSSVYIGGDDIGHIPSGFTVHQKDFLEPHIHNVSETEYQKKDHGR